MNVVLSIVFLLFASISFGADDECQEWFKSSKISPSSKNCLVECTSLITDMGTFHCPNECDSLCNSPLKEKLLFKYLYYPALTPSERALIAKYPKKAYIAYKQKNLAENRTDLYFPKGFVNDESDAFRHFVWANLLTKELGSDLAQKFLDAHENNTYQSEEARAMDLANNRAGLLEAQRLQQSNKLNLSEIEKSALKHLKEQKLSILNKRLKTPTGVKK